MNVVNKSIPTQLGAMLLELAHRISKYVIIDNVGCIGAHIVFKIAKDRIAHTQKQLQ